MSLPSALPSKLRHGPVDLAPRAVHAPEWRVRRQAVPWIERHSFTPRDAIAVLEALSRDSDGSHTMVRRVVRLPFDGRVLDRGSTIVDVELNQEVERRFLLVE